MGWVLRIKSTGNPKSMQRFPHFYQLLKDSDSACRDYLLHSFKLTCSVVKDVIISQRIVKINTVTHAEKARFILKNVQLIGKYAKPFASQSTHKIYQT